MCVTVSFKANHELIRLKNFVQLVFFPSIFSTPYIYQTFDMMA
jgi:hypothetical protein